MVKQSKADRHMAYEDRVRWLSDQLGRICPTGHATVVEIGVWKADFSHSALRVIPDLKWYGIDPYTTFRRRKQWNIGDWDSLYDKVVEKMKPFEDRFVPIRKTANDALPFIPDVVDIVFVDGDHRYAFVKPDINNYSQKVRKGGILCGHDYMTRDVARAVKEFEIEHDLKVVLENFEKVGFWWFQL